MVYDFNAGFSTLTLKRPTQPVKREAPNAKNIFLHAGENEAQYQSFIEAVSDLAQAFKFLPKYEQMNYKYGVPNASTDPAIVAEYDEALFEFDYTNDEIFGNFSKQATPGNDNLIWAQGAGRAYSNLEFSPDASDWDLLEGVDSGGNSILDEINSYFDWDSIKSIGAGQSFYQIAKSGALSDYTDEQAFDLMCSMTESKARVFGVLYDIFGDPANLTDDSSVIESISAWLDQYTEVDPHNLGALKMFFGMQTDFINTIDAYVNCQTYWGGDLATPVFSSDLGDFSDTLKAKAESYISSLSGEAKTAAESLEAEWFAPSPRWDKAGDTWTGELVSTDGSWVKFFQGKMDELNTEEIVRVLSCGIMNRSSSNRFRNEKSEYESKKEDAILQEIFLQKMQAKQMAANKKTFQKLLSRSASVSKAIRTVGRRGSSAPARRASAAGRGPAVSARRAPVAGARPSVKAAPTRMGAAGSHSIKRPAAAVGSRASAPARSRISNVAAKAPSQPVQAKPAQAAKHSKDDKKVI